MYGRSKDNLDIYQTLFPHDPPINKSPCILEVYGTPLSPPGHRNRVALGPTCKLYS